MRTQADRDFLGRHELLAGGGVEGQVTQRVQAAFATENAERDRCRVMDRSVIADGQEVTQQEVELTLVVTLGRRSETQNACADIAQVATDLEAARHRGDDLGLDLVARQATEHARLAAVRRAALAVDGEGAAAQEALLVVHPPDLPGGRVVHDFAFGTRVRLAGVEEPRSGGG